MAGSLPKPPPPTFAVGSSSSKPPPATFAIGSSLPKPLPATFAVGSSLPKPPPPTFAVGSSLSKPPPATFAIGSSLPKPPPATFTVGSSLPKPPPPTFAVGSSSPKPPLATFTGHPPYKELIDSYLRHRVVSGTKVGDFIHEADPYAADPELLTSQYSPATADNGERAWYFFTTLRPKAPFKKHKCKVDKCKKRTVDTGRKESWAYLYATTAVFSDRGSRRKRIGQYRPFAFTEKVDGNHVRSAWRMVQLSLDSDEGGQEAGSSDLLVMCKVYRKPNANVDDESSMAAAEADGEAPTASAVVTPGRKGADEDIGAETAAGPGRKRKAGDKDSETVASSPGHQKKADGESADAATTGEIFGDSSAPLDAPEEAEQEPRYPRDPPFYDFFSDLLNPKKH